MASWEGLRGPRRRFPAELEGTGFLTTSLPPSCVGGGPVSSVGLSHVAGPRGELGPGILRFHPARDEFFSKVTVEDSLGARGRRGVVAESGRRTWSGEAGGSVDRG